MGDVMSAFDGFENTCQALGAEAASLPPPSVCIFVNIFQTLFACFITIFFSACRLSSPSLMCSAEFLLSELEVQRLTAAKSVSAMEVDVRHSLQRSLPALNK